MIVEVTFLDYYNNLSTIYKHQYVCMSILIRQSTSVCITAEQTTIIMPRHVAIPLHYYTIYSYCNCLYVHIHESDWYCTVFMYTSGQHEWLTKVNSSAQHTIHHAIAIISYEYFSVSGFEVLVINSGVRRSGPRCRETQQQFWRTRYNPQIRRILTPETCGPLNTCALTSCSSLQSCAVPLSSSACRC